MKLDALEYLLVLHEAHDQLTFGTDRHKLTLAIETLRDAAPEHVIVRLLEAKMRRMAAIEAMLRAPRMGMSVLVQGQ